MSSEVACHPVALWQRRETSHCYLFHSKRFLDSARNDKEASQRHALLQLALQNFAGQLRVGFPFEKLHHLPFEKIKRCSIAGLEISSRLRVGQDHLIAECLDCTRVAQLLDPFFLDDLSRSFAAPEHFPNTSHAFFPAPFPPSH